MKHAAAIHSVPVSTIAIRDRHRRDMGDLAALAESIERDGLLQPIGITEQNRLVFGERRLRAVRDVLGKDKIEARIVRLESILTGEYVENELRKDFAPSERVEIAKAVSAELGNRQGQRTDKELPQNFGEVKGRETAEIAAQKAGFGNPETFRQAQKVVDSGTPSLVTAMDSGNLSIHAASKVATQPKVEQERILSLPKEQQRPAIKNLAPSPKRAREIAIQTGRPVVASNNRYVLAMSEEEERRLGDEQNKIGSIYRAMQLLAKPGISAAQMVSLGEKHFCRDLATLSRDATAWLLAVLEESNGKTKRVG